MEISGDQNKNNAVNILLKMRYLHTLSECTYVPPGVCVP